MSTAAGALEPGIYRFVLPTFEGPLDLLLHLIRINEVDIKDIPVVEIARQYDAMIDLMRDMNLEVAGEFLVMAATLVYIKSKMLLPADRERIEMGLEADPRQDLARALIAHARLREAAADLGERARVADLVFRRPAGPEAGEEGLLEVSLYDLATAFRRMLELAGRQAAQTLRRLQLSLAERIRQILDRLETADVVPFADLFDASASREERIVTFLAVLELVRLGSVSAWQVRAFDDIHLRRRTA